MSHMSRQDNDILSTPGSSNSEGVRARNSRTGKLRRRKGYSMMIDNTTTALPSFEDPATLELLTGNRTSPFVTTTEPQANISSSSSSASLRSSRVTPRKTMPGLQLRNLSPLFVDTSKNKHRHTRHFSPPSSSSRATSGSALMSPVGTDDIVADTIKLLLIGDAGVGKTALILKYCNELQLRRKVPVAPEPNLFLDQGIDDEGDYHDNHDDDDSFEEENADSVIDELDTNTPSTKNRDENSQEHRAEVLDPRLRNQSKNKQIKKLTRKQKCYSLNDYEELLASSYNPKQKLASMEKNNSKHRSRNSPKYDRNSSWRALHGYPPHGNNVVDGQNNIIDIGSNNSDYDDLMDDDDDDEDDQWEISTETTIGIDIKTQLINLDNRYFKVVLWDTAGQERFRQSLNPLMYKKTQGLILVYDICSLESLNSLMEYWIPEWIRNNSGVSCRCYLIGNKVDLYKNRKVTHEHVLKFMFEAEKKYPNFLFIGGNFEVSCKWLENNGVESSFSRILQDLISTGCYEVVKKAHTGDNAKTGLNGNSNPISSSSVELSPAATLTEGGSTGYYSDGFENNSINYKQDDNDPNDEDLVRDNSSVIDLTKNKKYVPPNENTAYGCCA